MKQPCEGCEDKLVFVQSEKSRWFGSSKGVSSHTLCRRCYRSFLNRVVAARMGPKPFWAVRSTLKLLEEQAGAVRMAGGR